MLLLSFRKRVMYMVVFSFFAGVVSAAESESGPHAVSGLESPELIDDNLAIDGFINSVVSLHGASPRQANAYLNVVFETANEDYSGLIEAIQSAVEQRDQRRQQTVGSICDAIDRNPTMTDLEFTDVVRQIDASESSAFANSLQNNVISVVGTDSYRKLRIYIDGEFKKTITQVSLQSEGFTLRKSDAISRLCK